jgi:antitoxin component of RelBE/YafQ-DinJ toxin-antitoxin module
MTSAQTTPNNTARATEKRRKRTGPPEQIRPRASTDDESLKWVSARLEPQLVRDIDAHAEKAGITRSDAIRDCLAIGLETIAERGGIPAGRAEHLLEALDGLRTAMDILGPPTFGLLRLLAHWATQGGGVKVNEDELLAEVRAVGGDEWEQAIAEAERDLHPAPHVSSKEGGR